MEEEINEPRKICPVCSRKYSGGDSYCSHDGTALVVAGTPQAPEPEIIRDYESRFAGARGSAGKEGLASELRRIINTVQRKERLIENGINI